MQPPDDITRAESIAEPTFTFGGYATVEGKVIGAGFWPRAAARIIDTAAHYVIGMLAGLCFGLLVSFAASAAGGSSAHLARIFRITPINYLFGILGSIAYHTICEGWHGSSLGKLMMGLVVVKEDGQFCDFKSAAGRSLVYFIDALFFGLIAASAISSSLQHQRYGDQWFHTVVPRRKDLRETQLRSGSRFVGVFFLAAAVDAILLIVPMLLKI
jgi:uncharacterized RDD family membrane protein YckC